jgi:hypothetical protein
MRRFHNVLTYLRFERVHEADDIVFYRRTNKDDINIYVSLQIGLVSIWKGWHFHSSVLIYDGEGIDDDYTLYQVLKQHNITR